MELHSPAAAKRLWNFLRVALFMRRKGLISKRKLFMDMNLMMKRGKIMGKNLGRNLIHHHNRPSSRGYGFTLQEYEFSCSNSPNPVFFHAKQRRHNYFPCLNAVVEEPDETPRPAHAVPRIEFTPSPSPSPQCLVLAPGEAKSPLRSPFSERISNFSEEEEEEGEVGEGLSSEEVDDDAEQFIRRFYEQLRGQRRIALIQYQEMEVEEMLARGQ